ncbi:EscU/YscU/HrcU family type III secretion system export apparatus switch protein [Priestia flexa]|uniref:EscU/YscU/HrcU family type III secretion system export apparatus switch protein n=1 Tax=Priestia flexa TaxID=86664 RepID=UPI003D02222C
MSINDRKQKAVALTYNQERDEAPRTVAKGSGEVAKRIIEQAQEHNVPVQKDASLTELVSTLTIHEKIPSELYEVVAEVFAFVYQLDQEIKKK